MKIVEKGDIIKNDDIQEFKANVYRVVSEIPKGYVLTYGMLALLAGRPRNARLVGKIMSEAPRDLTSHRVVNSQGRTVLGWSEQRFLLEDEGVEFTPNGYVKMKKHLWR